MRDCLWAGRSAQLSRFLGGIQCPDFLRGCAGGKLPVFRRKGCCGRDRCLRCNICFCGGIFRLFDTFGHGICDKGSGANSVSGDWDGTRAAGTLVRKYLQGSGVDSGSNAFLNTFGKRKNAYATTLNITAVSYIVYVNDWLYHMDSAETSMRVMKELNITQIILSAVGIAAFALSRKLGKDKDD